MDIVCHAFPAWEGNYVKSTVELMKAAAKQGHRVLYVDYAYTWTDFLKSMLGKNHASWKRMLGLESRLRRFPLPQEQANADGHHPYIQVLTLPPVLPANFIKHPRLHDWVNRFNSFWIGRTIRHTLRAIKMNAPVVVNAFNPGFGLQLAGKLGERRLVYYCYDEIGAAAWASRHGARQEEAFLKKCDAVIVSSEGLRLKQEKRSNTVFVVKNGVDIALFDKVIAAEALPEIPNRYPGEKIIGYLGSIDDRLDMGLLEGLFQQFSQARFVFVGRVQYDALYKRLSAFPNVILAGVHAPEALPGWVARMDVCLVPFVKNEFTAAIYPLKINEYLAAGKPVVSTNFAPLSDFSGIAAITDTADAFQQALQQALQEPSDESANKTRAERRVFARHNSWENKARLFVNACNT